MIWALDGAVLHPDMSLVSFGYKILSSGAAAISPAEPQSEISDCCLADGWRIDENTIHGKWKVIWAWSSVPRQRHCTTTSHIGALRWSVPRMFFWYIRFLVLTSFATSSGFLWDGIPPGQRSAIHHLSGYVQLFERYLSLCLTDCHFCPRRNESCQ